MGWSNLRTIASTFVKINFIWTKFHSDILWWRISTDPIMHLRYLFISKRPNWLLRTSKAIRRRSWIFSCHICSSLASFYWTHEQSFWKLLVSKAYRMNERWSTYWGFKYDKDKNHLDLLELAWNEINSKTNWVIKISIPYKPNDKNVQESRKGTCRRH